MQLEKGSNATEFEIEYETPGPVAFESPLGDDPGGPQISRGKKIVIDLERPWPYESEGEMFTLVSKHMEIEHIPEVLPMLL